MSAAVGPGTGRIRGAIDALLHLHDTPGRTAAAFALGVFFSFSPFLGLQIVLSMLLAFALGLNRAAVFLGLNTNLPWFMAPWYAFTTAAAAAVLGLASPGSRGQEVEALFEAGVTTAAFWRQARSVISPLAVAFLVGPTVGAAAVAGAAFAAVRVWLVRRAGGPAAARSR